MEKKKLVSVLIIFLFVFMVFSDARTIGRNTAIVENSWIGNNQEEPQFVVKVSALEELDFVDKITFAVSGVRMDKVELVELNFISATLQPKGSSIVLAKIEMPSFQAYEQHLYVGTFPPLSASGEYEIKVTASWLTPWNTLVNGTGSADFHIDHWRNITSIGQAYLDDLDKKANDIIYGLNILDTGGDDILATMSTRLACVDLLQKALLIWSALPSEWDFTVLRIEGLQSDDNATFLEQQFNESIPVLSSLGQTYNVRYIHSIEEFESLINNSQWLSPVNYSIFFNLHGSYIPTPEKYADLLDYPVWIDKIGNSSEAGHWTWVSVGRGTPFRFITWRNETSGSVSYRPIDTIYMLKYFYDHYAQTFEGNYVPTTTVTNDPQRIAPYTEALLNVDQWGKSGFSNRYASLGYQYDYRVAHGWGTYQVGAIDQVASATSYFPWATKGGSVQYSPILISNTTYVKDIAIKYRSLDYYNYTTYPSEPHLYQGIFAEPVDAFMKGDDSKYALKNPDSPKSGDVITNITFRYRSAENLTALNSASWIEVKLPKAFVNYSRNAVTNQPTWGFPNPYGYDTTIDASGTSEWMNYIETKEPQSEPQIYLPSGEKNMFVLQDTVASINLPIDIFPSNLSLYIQFNFSMYLTFDPMSWSSYGIGYYSFISFDIYPLLFTPQIYSISYTYDNAPPENFNFVDTYPSNLPVNATPIERSYSSNNTISYSSDLVGYTNNLLNVKLPQTVDTSNAWLLPSLFDAKKFYFTITGDIALGVRVSTGGIFVHSVLPANITLYSLLGAIWKGWEEGVTGIINDLTKIYYATQYNYPFIANESQVLRWDLLEAWNDRDLPRVRDKLFTAISIADETFRRYDDPLKTMFNFSLALAQINISQNVLAMQDQAESIGADLEAAVLAKSAELNETLNGITLVDQITKTLRNVFIILTAAFGAGAVIAGILGSWGAAVAFGGLAVACGVIAWQISSLGAVLTEWQNKIVDTVSGIVYQALSVAVKSINAFIGVTLQTLVNITKDLEYRVNVVLRDITLKLNDFADKIREAVKAVLELIVRVRADVLNFVIESLRLIKDFFFLALSSLLDGVSNLADQIGIISENLQKSVAFVPELAGSVVRTVTEAAKNSEFVRYILDFFGVTDDAFMLAESVANSISNSRMADTGLGLIIANPFVEKNVLSPIYLIALNYGDLHDFSSLSLNIVNSMSVYYQYPFNITRIGVGIYKVSTQIPEGKYTLSAQFRGSEEAYSTEPITSGKKYFLSDVSLSVALETDKETYRSGDTIDLKIWTTNPMYSYNYVNVEVRLIDALTKVVVLREEKLGLFINAEETKVTTVSVEIPWYLFPTNYILEVEITEPNGEVSTATYSIKVEWALWTYVLCFSPALVINGLPIMLFVWILIAFSLGKWSVGKAYNKIKPKQESQRIIRRYSKKAETN
jgi:hypothetical protein